jgi:hydrogenase maturation protein HypF
VGAELKNSFCLARDSYAFISQHIGDMENLETLEHFTETVALYRRLFRVEPQVVAHDMHPDYAATRYALEQPGEHVAVQHHHAHLASCLADGGRPDEPAIGVIMDGTGYGTDGHIWGGEFLLGDARGYCRAAHLAYLPLPGGDAATRRPYRIALAYMQALADRRPLPPALAGVPQVERDTVRAMVERGLNTPLTSSAGRLFDAVSAMLGVCGEVSYEAQAAIELEEVARTAGIVDGITPYEYVLDHAGEAERRGQVSLPVINARTIRLERLIGGMLDDVTADVPTGQIACRFHLTLARMIADTCATLRGDTGLDRVALSGGCFQNRLLLELTNVSLRAAGFTVLTHRRVPCNDGGLALGQAAVAHYHTHGG